jgi:hypothetical protein
MADGLSATNRPSQFLQNDRVLGKKRTDDNRADEDRINVLEQDNRSLHTAMFTIDDISCRGSGCCRPELR